MNALLTPDLAEQIAALLRPLRPTAAGIGMPGIRTATQADAVSTAVSAALDGIPVYVRGDGEMALIGAFGCEPGIVVFAGTGSGAVGFDGARWARTGGHGFLLGDEGSAYWLGRAALNAALRWEDGMGGSQTVHDAVLAAADCSLADLVRMIHNHCAERPLVTAFAPLLTSLAEQDTVAAAIVDEAADHLADLASALRRRLGTDGSAAGEKGTPGALPVCGMGGVLSASAMWSRFSARTGAVRPLAPPEVGAALLAGAPEAAGIRKSVGSLV
jgi:N-acetylglucosamine kinase-like BadF-type ATPase